MGDAPSNTSTLSLWKKACFGMFVTAGCFLLLECLLALLGVRATLENHDPYVGFESSIPLFVEETGGGQPMLKTAANKLRYFNAQRFSKSKAPNTLRVFCLGGSTTFGRPFDDRTSYAGWLRELLPLADRQKQWEVINTGGVSYASYRVAAVMDELVKYSPDVFIVYTGHNEFLEERTYGELKDTPPQLRQWTAPLVRSRTYSIARSLLRTDEADSEATTLLPSEVDAILDHSVGPDAYHRDDRLRSQILEHYQFNLHRMVDTARSAGATVIFVTPAANLKDFSPFKSEFAAGLGEEQRQRWSRLSDSAIDAEANGDLDGALSSWKQAATIDGRRADLHYHVARLLFARGQFAEARESFQRAIDEDVCPLRATTAIQRSVEQIAVERRVPLVDFQSIVGGACLETQRHACPGREYFVDHVHPTVAGHRLLSLAIVEAMAQCGIVAYDRQWGDAAIALATGRIESAIDPELQTRALTNLAQVLSWAGKQGEAGPIAQQAVRLRAQASLGEDAEVMFYAAVSHAVVGRDEEAIALLKRVVQLEPSNAQAQWRLASLLYDQLRFEESLMHFRAAVRLDPRDAFSQQMLGNVLIKLARYDDALAALNQAAELTPDDEVVRENIAIVRSKIAGG